MKLLRIILASMAVVFVGLLVACMARAEKASDGCSGMSPMAHGGHAMGANDGANEDCPMMAKDGASASSPTAPSVYTCPMDPEVVSNKPGKCPKCGMNLVAKQEKPKGDQKPPGKNDSGGDSGHSGHMHNH